MGVREMPVPGWASDDTWLEFQKTGSGKTSGRNGSVSPAEHLLIDELLSRVRQAELGEVWLTAGALEDSARCPVCGLDGFWKCADCSFARFNLSHSLRHRRRSVS